MIRSSVFSSLGPAVEIERERERERESTVSLNAFMSLQAKLTTLYTSETSLFFECNLICQLFQLQHSIKFDVYTGSHFNK